MLVSGRANPELAAQDRRQARRRARRRDAEDVRQRRGLLPLRGVGARRRRVHRPADVRQPRQGLSANDALMELLVMVDAAVGGSAHRVIAVTPWYGYSRQDKKSAPREPISARLVARMLESAGIDRILTMDLHSGQIQGFFQKPCDHMTALFMLTQYFADLGLEDLVVVAPDAGRVKLNKQFAVEDRRRPRDPQQGAPGPAGRRDQLRDRRRRGQDRGDRRRHHRHRRHAQGRRRGGASTPAPAASTPPRRTASSPATRGRTWPPPASSRSSSPTRSRSPPGAPDNVRVLSCADLLTNSIRQIFTDGSVSDVFGGENQLF